MLSIDHEDLLLTTFDYPERVSPDDREKLLALLLTDSYLDALTNALLRHDDAGRTSLLGDIFVILLTDLTSTLPATDDCYRESIRLDLLQQIRDDERDDAGDIFARQVLDRLKEDLTD